MNHTLGITFLLLLGLIYSCQTWENKSMTYSEGKEKDSRHFIPSQNECFDLAYAEINSMLEGKAPLDFKRAVFLTEWAFKDGGMNYDAFVEEITQTGHKLEAFIQQKGIDQYKTAGNFALFEFFTKSNKMNAYQPLVYDFEDFMGLEDWEQTFVTKLLKTHKGQCHSLPFLYMILAEEINAEAYLAVAPNHFYIKHIDEQGKWVNIELTNGNFSSDAWMIASTGISAESIKSGIYMDALNLREMIAYCLTDLAQGYERRYGYDEFVLDCCNQTLAHFPQSIHTLMQKHNTLVALNVQESQENNRAMYAQDHFEELRRNKTLIESLGYRELPPEDYEKWLRDINEEKVTTMVSESNAK